MVKHFGMRSFLWWKRGGACYRVTSARTSFVMRRWATASGWCVQRKSQRTKSASGEGQDIWGWCLGPDWKAAPSGPTRRPRVPRASRRRNGPRSARVCRSTSRTPIRQVQAPIGVKPVLKAWMELAWRGRHTGVALGV